MDHPYHNLSEEEVGDLQLFDEEKKVNSELFDYMKTKLMELQQNFMRSLKEAGAESYAKLMFDELRGLADKIRPFDSVLALRLQKSAMIAQTVYAFDSSDEAVQNWFEPIDLRGIYSPIVEALMFAFRKRLSVPFGIGSFALGMRDAFIKRVGPN